MSYFFLAGRFTLRTWTAFYYTVASIFFLLSVKGCSEAFIVSRTSFAKAFHWLSGRSSPSLSESLSSESFFYDSFSKFVFASVRQRSLFARIVRSLASTSSRIVSSTEVLCLFLSSVPCLFCLLLMESSWRVETAPITSFRLSFCYFCFRIYRMLYGRFAGLPSVTSVLEFLGRSVLLNLLLS